MSLADQLTEAAKIKDEQSPWKRAEVRKFVRDWPKNPREVSEDLMEKYGPPWDVGWGQLVWYGVGPWKRIILHRTEVPHNWPSLHMDVLEQVIYYKVPVYRFAELARFDGSVWAKRTWGEMSAMCGGETMNYVALNLAHAVAKEQFSAEQAREEYVRVVRAMERPGGKMPDIAKGLAFDPDPVGAADPDNEVL